MPRIMNKKDIEDFLRRSNSITDQIPSPLDEAEVPVRRMSLKEFTGLDPSNKEQIAELSLASWKKSAPSSLINTYSARRRSVLSNDPTDSPSRRLSAQKEESVDLGTAIDKVCLLRQSLSVASEPEATHMDSDDGGYGERRKLLEDARVMVAAVKEFGELASLQDSKMNSVVAELADAAETLLSSALIVISCGSVYQSQLVATELNQVLSGLEALLTELRTLTDAGEHGMPVKHVTHLSSAANQLVLAMSALN